MDNAHGQNEDDSQEMTKNKRVNPLRVLQRFIQQQRPLRLKEPLKVIVFWIVCPTFISIFLWIALWLITRPSSLTWKKYEFPPFNWWARWEVLLTILGILPFLILLLWKIPQRHRDQLHNRIDTDDYRKLEPKDRIQLHKDFAKFEIDSRLALAQIIGGAIVLIGIYFTAESVRLAQRNLEANQASLMNAQQTASENTLNTRASIVMSQERALNEQFTQAVQQLGKSDQSKENNLTLRLGAIHTLEQLAWQPYPAEKNQTEHEPLISLKTPVGDMTAVLRRHAPVMKILAAFIRENATIQKFEEARQTATARGILKYWPPADIDAALQVITHRKLSKRPGTTEVDYLDLSGAILIDADLIGANLERTLLFDAHLNGVDLRGANLRGAILDRAILDGAHLEGADLTGATGVDWDSLIKVVSVDDKTIRP